MAASFPDLALGRLHIAASRPLQKWMLKHARKVRALAEEAEEAERFAKRLLLKNREGMESR